MAHPVQQILETTLTTYKMMGKESTTLLIGFLNALLTAMQKGRGPVIPESLKMKEGEGQLYFPEDEGTPKLKL